MRSVMDEKAKAEAGKAKAADAKDEAAKGIPDFSMGWGY